MDGQVAAADADRPLRVPAGWHTLEFKYTALSFSAPSKVRFKYRLQGRTEEWIDADAWRSANFTSIPPGSYTFQVIASNNDGIWNTLGASLPFVVLPSFWQTWWFRLILGVVIALCGGLVVWLASRRRIRRQLENMARQQAVENERARIAKDIHDDFGARLTRISMLSAMGPSERGNTSRLLTNLGQIRETALELTQAIGEVVWATTPKHDTLKSLVTYVERFGHRFLEGTGVRCRIDIPDLIAAHELTAEARHNTFLALKEAINNAVKHSRASEVRLSVLVNAETCIFTVEDNGIGIPRETSANRPITEALGEFSGNGLQNMKLRMHEIGGACEISSSGEKGTIIRLIVPLRTKIESVDI